MSRRRTRASLDEKRIDAIFADVNQSQLPGVAVGIAINGKPVYRKGFGLANIELPVVLSPSIRMRIYSTTKHFTCLAFMLLCEDGKAEIDDPIGKYLTELHPASRNVTMRQLMGHVSGLRDASDICWQLSGTGTSATSADLLGLYRDIDDVNAQPGTTWSYNNGGYLMLSAAVERITGQALEDVLRERIFEPVGMHDTLLRRQDTDFVPQSATMHMTDGRTGYERSYLGAVTGEGGIVSTVNDMLRWLTHMDAPFVGSDATWRTMKTPLILANHTSTGYGLGLQRAAYRGVDTLSHSGGGMGANSQMVKVSDADLDIAIMANRHDVSAAVLALQIVDACIPGLDPLPTKDSAITATGAFRSQSTGRLIQLSGSQHASPFAKVGQQVALIDGLEVPLEWVAEGVMKPTLDRILLRGVRQTLKLTGDPERPSSILYSDFGHLDEFQPVRSKPNGNVDLVAGRYRSTSTRTEAVIRDSDDGPRLSTTGRFGTAEFELVSLTEGIWRAKSMSPMPWGGIVAFDADRAAFHFTTTRTRALPFHRVT